MVCFKAHRNIYIFPTRNREVFNIKVIAVMDIITSHHTIKMRTKLPNIPALQPHAYIALSCAEDQNYS